VNACAKNAKSIRVSRDIKLSKKAMITTLLIVQLIFLVIITMSALQSQRENFSQTTQFRKIAADRIKTLYYDIAGDISTLKDINASESSMQQYISFAETNVPAYYGVEIVINSSYLSLYDHSLEISKEGQI
jgi:hypothetical protein